LALFVQAWKPKELPSKGRKIRIVDEPETEKRKTNSCLCFSSNIRSIKCVMKLRQTLTANKSMIETKQKMQLVIRQTNTK
jgi:hypothetical protein